MPSDEALHDRIADGRGEIHVAHAEESSARIGAARLKSRPGQLHKGMMLANGDDAGSRHHATHQETWLVALKRQGDFHLGILRKVFGARQVERGSRQIETERPSALADAAKRAGNIMRV